MIAVVRTLSGRIHFNVNQSLNIYCIECYFQWKKPGLWIQVASRYCIINKSQNKIISNKYFNPYELDDFLGQGSSSLKKQPAVSISKKPPSTTSSTAVKPSTSGAGAKRSFVKASWSIQNELLEHDEKDPTTMVANLKRIKEEAEGQRYTTFGTFWADLILCIQ